MSASRLLSRVTPLSFPLYLSALLRSLVPSRLFFGIFMVVGIAGSVGHAQNPLRVPPVLTGPVYNLTI